MKLYALNFKTKKANNDTVDCIEKVYIISDYTIEINVMGKKIFTTPISYQVPNMRYPR